MKPTVVIKVIYLGVSTTVQVCCANDLGSLGQQVLVTQFFFISTSKKVTKIYGFFWGKSYV